MQWITLAIKALALLPALIEAIKCVEAAIPGQGKGEQKLAVIRGVLETVAGESNEMLPLIEKLVAKIVDIFNFTGAFKK
jgi:hypothetical protein